MKIDLLSDVVQLGVFLRDGDCVLVSVARNYRRPSRTVGPGTHFSGSDCQDSRAGANVEKAAAAIMLRNRLQTESRRFVSAGTERHAGVNPNNDRVDILRLWQPRRRDDEAAYRDRLPTLFPFCQPIAIFDFANADVVKR